MKVSELEITNNGLMEFSDFLTQNELSDLDGDALNSALNIIEYCEQILALQGYDVTPPHK